MCSRLDDVCHHLGFAVALRRSPQKTRLPRSLLGGLDNNVQWQWQAVSLHSNWRNGLLGDVCSIVFSAAKPYWQLCYYYKTHIHIVVNYTRYTSTSR